MSTDPSDCAPLDEHIKRNWLTEQIPCKRWETPLLGQILSLFTGPHAFRHNHLVQLVHEVFDDVVRTRFLDEVLQRSDQS